MRRHYAKPCGISTFFTCARTHTRDLCYTNGMSSHTRKAGQALVEYVIVFVALLGVITALMFFIDAAKASSTRTTTFVTCEYP